MSLHTPWVHIRGSSQVNLVELLVGISDWKGPGFLRFWKRGEHYDVCQLEHAYWLCYYINCLLYPIFSTEVPPLFPSVPIIHMDNIPPTNSQRPRSFHPDFDREVFSVIFSVGTIISSSWWSILSVPRFMEKVSRLMLHDWPCIPNFCGICSLIVMGTLACQRKALLTIQSLFMDVLSKHSLTS